MVNTAIPRPARPPRRRPPLRSYIPFTIFAACCLVLVVAIILLLVHLFSPGGSGAATPPMTRTPTAVPTMTVPASTPTSGSATAAASSHGGATKTPAGTSLLPAPHRSPQPTASGAPTAKKATKPVKASLVIARGVQGDSPVEPATRFLSPAIRLYAFATVHDVKVHDALRFVFKRNGVTLPHDDITIKAGKTMAVHAFHVFADYKGGAAPLPVGNYSVLFYHNGRLEAEAPFRVG